MAASVAVLVVVWHTRTMDSAMFKQAMPIYFIAIILLVSATVISIANNDLGNSLGFAAAALILLPDLVQRFRDRNKK